MPLWPGTDASPAIRAQVAANDCIARLAIDALVAPEDQSIVHVIGQLAKAVSPDFARSARSITDPAFLTEFGVARTNGADSRWPLAVRRGPRRPCESADGTGPGPSFRAGVPWDCLISLCLAPDYRKRGSSIRPLPPGHALEHDPGMGAQSGLHRGPERGNSRTASGLARGRAGKREKSRLWASRSAIWTLFPPRSFDQFVSLIRTG